MRLGLYPNLGRAWFWAYLAGRDRPLIAVRDHDLELPRTGGLEARGEGLWSALNCETALDHWSVGLEAFAVALDDPLEAYRGERGDRVALGFDLEWEARGPALDSGPFVSGSSGYDQGCDVFGEILLGSGTVAFEGPGFRDHSWGVQDWWAGPRCRLTGRLSDGSEVRSDDLDAVLDRDGLLCSARFRLGDDVLDASPAAVAPLLLEAPDGRRARLARSLCLINSPDGHAGAGWADWLQPAT